MSGRGAGSLLLIEDDEDVREATALLLRRHGFVVHTAPDGVAAFETLDAQHIDAVVADVAMPRMDGITFVRRLRRDSTTPVLLLTARDTPGDVVTGLQAGADDHVAKPWDGEVLVARIQALIRRSSPSPAAVAIRGVKIDRTARTVMRAGSPVEVSATEFRLLDALLDARGAVLSRHQLLRAAWGEQWIDERVVDTNVRRLRVKLGEEIVTTVRGFGYRIDEP